ncbi:MAG TPA: hypothetical protein VEO54_08530 [Thermoanaerobaculia bacterium]|nr:hypothetical protein [Thermoanaerobaculia bacterium]
MLTHLLIKKPAMFIEGRELLYLLQHESAQASHTAPTETGQDRENAMNLDDDDPSGWLGTARTQQNGGGTYYMTFAGRMLYIDAMLYVSDVGSATATTVKVKDAWNDGVAPTYREIARQLNKENISNPKRSASFARSMRALFQNNGTADKTHGAMLPVLMGAMFIAETRRNEKAWAINLMLLDFAESSVTYGHEGRKVYTWEKILWHPEALDLDSGAPNPGVLARRQVSKPQIGPTGVGAVIGAIDTIGGLHRVGGKMPASPTGGGTGGNAIAGGAAGMNYIHQKEASILIRWLVARHAGEGWQGASNATGTAPVIGFHADAYRYMSGDTKPIFKAIRQDLVARIGSFDNLLV